MVASLDRKKGIFLVAKYLPLSLITLFVLSGNIFAAYQGKLTPSGDTLYEYTPTSVAKTVLAVSSYTPVIEEDPVALTLAFSAEEDKSYLSKPVVMTTETTNEPRPVEYAPPKRTANMDYVVQDGETLSDIGWKFGLKIATLKYTNNLSDINTIKPGQKIVISPADLSDTQLAKMREKELAQNTRQTVSRSVSATKGTGRYLPKDGGAGNSYPYGWCTWYVASKRYVPSHWGNAGNWLNSARSAGYSTGGEPRPGAIVVTKESGYGHVAYVESVNGETITISEMNLVGFGRVSSRTIPAHYWAIKGYIY